MKNQDLYDLFLDELKDMYSSENQIVEALPKMIQAATYKGLKDALSSHLEETENQVKRLEEVFKILGVPAEEIHCEGMEGILKEGDEMIEDKAKSPVLDVAIISAAQKVEHYEIASYGTLRSIAEHLDLSDKVIELLQDNLDEEGAADKKLTKLADGGFFTSGVNEDAASGGNKKRK